MTQRSIMRIIGIVLALLCLLVVRMSANGESTPAATKKKLITTS